MLLKYQLCTVYYAVVMGYCFQGFLSPSGEKARGNIQQCTLYSIYYWFLQRLRNVPICELDGSLLLFSLNLYINPCRLF